MKTSTGKKILFASTRGDFAEVAQALTRRGFSVHTCGDGSQALERALAMVPDLMVADVDLPMIDGSRLSQILRANPRTDKLAFLFVGPEGREVEGFRRHRDHYLARPFNHEQLLSVALGHLSRQERTEEVTRGGKQVEGDLEQVSLTDMLQILGHNRKDGTLKLERDSGRGEIQLLEGTVVNARLGSVEGEKAFFRLLTWEKGHFSFSPGVAGGEVRITQPLDHLIMEGLRQSDELNAMFGDLPPHDAFLALKVPLERLPRGLRPTTQEILVLLEHHPRLGDLLDHCPRSDYDILQIVKILIEKGLIEVRREQSAAGISRSLLPSEEIIRLKDRLGEGDSLLEEATMKLLVLASASEDVQRLIQSFQGIAEFRVEPGGAAALGLGTIHDIGHLRLGETFSLRLLLLPAMEDAGPLWAPFCRRLLGVLSFCGSGRAGSAEQFFASRAKVPLARIIFNEAEGEGFMLNRGDREGVRKLLVYLMTEFIQKDLDHD